jgi:4-nitrophenyl phosphatase
MTALTDIKGLLIDMDGVLYRGLEPIEGAKEFLSFVEGQGIPFLLFTNNSTLTPEQYVAKLAAMDIQVTPEHVFTSAQATAMYLPNVVQPGSRVFVIGKDGLRTAVTAGGYVIVDSKDVDAVVMGMDMDLDYRKLRIATLAIRAGAAFVGTNPDRTFPSEEGIVPGTGAGLAAVEAATDVAPILVGKPEATIFEIALTKLGTSREETAMIGDRPETDLVGAERVGIKTIFVLTGVADESDLAVMDAPPDWIYPSLFELHADWVSELKN